LRNNQYTACFIALFLFISCQIKVERNQLKDSNISTKNFKIPQSVGFIAGDTINFLANGKATSDKFPLVPATYNLILNGKGTQAYNVYPKLKIYLNDKLIGEPQLGNDYAPSTIEFKIDRKDMYQLFIEFDSDGLDKGNDRNALIQSISIQKK